MTSTSDFLSGVIEGFYGAPWSAAERAELFEWMTRWRLNTYMYAPKDDLKHRAVWRESYTSDEADRFRELIATCSARGIRFIYAISPGLDINYNDPSELHTLQRRVDQMMSLGCRDFALLFDDIPDTLDPAVTARFGSLASAQCDITNALARWILEKAQTQAQAANPRIAFCPTPYCSRMLRAGLGGADYLPTVGRELLPSIDVFWTGPDIVSREITEEHVLEISSILRRRPIIWDNLFANDYDGHRFFVGPYSGRPDVLRTATRGLLLNPNNELPLNYVPLHTFSAFVHDADGAYDPRTAYLSGMREWTAWFDTITGPIPQDDVILLGDCYYLPYEDGPEATALYQQASELLARMADGNHRPDEAARFRQRAGHLRQLCVRLAELRRRPLFHALSRRVWDLKEELDLLDKFVAASGHPTFTSDFHRPGTYRGGLVAKLQRLLVPQADATFTSAPPASPPPPQSRETFTIRPTRPGDEPGAYYVCLKTGDYGQDAELFYRDDPDALGRIFVGPYLAFEPDLSLILEDAEGICGYTLAALDSRAFYDRYEREWRPDLAARFPAPQGDPAEWTRVEHIHHLYHHPDYFCPEPYAAYPSHVHIDLLPRAQGQGLGGRMLTRMFEALAERGSPGVHLGVHARNSRACAFYRKIGFTELTRDGEGLDAIIYMGLPLRK